MAELTGAKLVVEYLTKQNVKHIFFGPLGHTNMEIADFLYSKRDAPSPIFSRFEVVSSFMAEGYFKATGKPGVVSVHYGPGMGYAVNGIISAYLNASAVVGIFGDVASKWWGKQCHHEVDYSNAVRIFEPISKKVWQISRTDKIRDILPQAFNIALSGRPGPTIMSISTDALAGSIDATVPEPISFEPLRSVGERERIDEAIRLLLDSENPVIVAGAGAVISGASAELTELAEKLVIPIVTTDSSKGVIPEEHYLCAGVVGLQGTKPANRIVSEADVIFAIGTKMSEFTTGSWEYGRPFRIPPQKLIQLDVNPNEIGKNYQVTVPIFGDARATLREMIRGVEFMSARPDGRTSRRQKIVSDLKKEWLETIQPLLDSNEKPIAVARLVRELQDLLPKQSIVVPDSGRNRSVFIFLWKAHGPRSIFMDSGNASMGYGPCAALGAKVGQPGKEVVSCVGDGGFLMVNSVLATAVDYGLSVKYVIFNDAALVGIYSMQKDFYQKRILGTTFDDSKKGMFKIDFASMAKSYGVASASVDDPALLRPRLKEMLGSDSPYLLDVALSREGPELKGDIGSDWNKWKGL